MRLLLGDVRGAIRSLLKQPRFTVVASLTLALGVGAVTAIFSIVNGLLLKPLPYPDADRLVNVWSHAPKLGYNQFPLSPDLFFLFEKEAQFFKSMALSQARRANLTSDGPPDVVDALFTTHTYFATLGVPIARGRGFSAEEDSPKGARVVVLSHRAWRDRFGSDPSILGRAIRLDGEPTEVIGVASASIDQRGTPDFYMPARLNRETPMQGNFGWNAIARLQPDVLPATAASHLTSIVTRLRETIASATYRAFLTDGNYQARVNLMKEDIVGSLERPLWILLGTVGMLLLIACANVANLFLVRAEGRQLEIAVRVALGASRAALVRALLIEALVLAAVGSTLGLLAAGAGLPALLRLAPPTIPQLDLVTLDLRVMLFAAGMAVLSALLFGLIPALRYTRPRSMAALRHGSRGGTDEPARRRARNALVVVQTAIALVLLVGSGLLMRSFSRLVGTDPGFDPTDVMTFRVALPPGQYREDAAVATFVDRMIERLSGLPGVERAGATTTLPVANSAPGTAYEFEGQTIATGTLPPMVHYKAIAGAYFETMRIPVLRGRNYHSGDFAPDVRTLIVNEALADHYWRGQDPIGKRIRRASSDAANPPPWYTVVGVVGTERQDGLRRPIRPLLYYARREATSEEAPKTFAYVVRGPGITARAEELRQTVWTLDRSLPVAATRSMDDIVSASIVEFTFTMLTLGIASAMALLLGAVGLYGVLSYAVTLRTREIGVRLALGASAAVVMRSVVATGAALATIGLVIGLAAAAGLSRFMRGLLFETEPLDPWTFAGMSAALLSVAVLASYLPARRAAHVSPLESMKAD